MFTRQADGQPMCPQEFGLGGMTLRDYFAGQALTSVLKGTGDLQTYYDYQCGSKGDNSIPSPLAIAKYSYELADAMLTASTEGAT
jgi:hypothetical protein